VPGTAIAFRAVNMFQAKRTIAIVALSALSCIQCGGDQKTPETPEALPSAEPPAEPMPETDAGTDAHAKTSDATPAKTQSAAENIGSSAAQAPLEPLSDPQIAAVTEAANTAEIAQAKLAQSKSKDASVKRFAAMMIEHHGAAKQKQAKLKLKTEPSAASTALQADAESTLDKLKTDSGKDFDHAYIAAQIDGHRKVLDAINDKLLPNVKGAELKAYLEEIKPRVEQHLKEAKRLQENMDSKSSALTHSDKPAGETLRRPRKRVDAPTQKPGGASKKRCMSKRAARCALGVPRKR
jgi:putative membrane protein